MCGGGGVIPRSYRIRLRPTDSTVHSTVPSVMHCICMQLSEGTHALQTVCIQHTRPFIMASRETSSPCPYSAHARTPGAHIHFFFSLWRMRMANKAEERPLRRHTVVYLCVCVMTMSSGLGWISNAQENHSIRQHSKLPCSQLPK